MRKEMRKSIFSRIEFKWRPSDEKILEQIRRSVDEALYGKLFSYAIDVMDGLYAEIRVADTTSEGVVKTDSQGRVIWQKDSRGREIEDWSLLTGQDVEKCLLDMTRLKLELAPQLSDLLMEAVYAKHIADDEFQEAYSELLAGTIGDRNAHAARKSRDDKYHAFYRYYLYKHAEAFMTEINNFCRVLERIRFWRIDEQGKAT